MPVPLNPALIENSIPFEKIMRMRRNYQEKPPIINTESGWISVEEIKMLIDHNNATGIRIYLARHDEDDTLYPDKNTVVLVATRDFTHPASKPTTEYSRDILDENATISVSGIYGSMGVDMIPLCPPNCPHP
jgi:hypothetical protein